MSKRALNAGLKAYPPTYTTVKRHAKRVQGELVDTHKPVRTIFQQGYEQAEKDCREEVASCKAKNWQEGYNEGYKRAKSENVLDWEDEVVLDWEDEVVVDEDGFPCIKTLNFHDDDEDEPLFKPGDKVVITVRKKQSEN